MEKTFSGHIILAKFLYGSQNYGLDTPTSDEDYRYIVMPTRAEVFARDFANRKLTEHDSQMDVREFMGHLVKANPNTIELLFSTKQEYYDVLFKDTIDKFKAKYLNVILWQNKRDFFNACKGIALNSLQRDKTLKGYSRAVYYTEFLNRLRRDDFIMTEDTWRPSQIDSFNTAPLIRNGTIAAPKSEQEIQFMFKNLETAYNQETVSSYKDLAFSEFFEVFYRLFKSYYFRENEND